MSKNQTKDLRLKKTAGQGTGSLTADYLTKTKQTGCGNLEAEKQTSGTKVQKQGKHENVRYHSGYSTILSWWPAAGSLDKSHPGWATAVANVI